MVDYYEQALLQATGKCYVTTLHIVIHVLFCINAGIQGQLLRSGRDLQTTFVALWEKLIGNTLTLDVPEILLHFFIIALH